MKDSLKYYLLIFCIILGCNTDKRPLTVKEVLGNDLFKYYTELNCEDSAILTGDLALLCEKMNKIIELNNSNTKDIDNFIDKMMLQLIMEIDTLIYKYNSSL